MKNHYHHFHIERYLTNIKNESANAFARWSVSRVNQWCLLKAMKTMYNIWMVCITTRCVLYTKNCGRFEGCCCSRSQQRFTLTEKKEQKDKIRQRERQEKRDWEMLEATCCRGNKQTNRIWKAHILVCKSTRLHSTNTQTFLKWYIKTHARTQPFS